MIQTNFVWTISADIRPMFTFCFLHDIAPMLCGVIEYPNEDSKFYTMDYMLPQKPPPFFIRFPWDN